MCEIHLPGWVRCAFLTSMINVLEQLLVPLARLLVSRGIQFREAAETFKRAYLAAAKSAGATTDSRVSILTGLQRRDVARLRSGGRGPKVRRTGLGQILRGWHDDPAYCGADGAPLPVPRLGPAPSFEALVRTLRKDVHPRSVLDVLVAKDAVIWDEAADTIVPKASRMELGSSMSQMETLGGNLGDHAAAAVENVLGKGRFFDRALEYEGLTDDDVQALSARFDREMMALLQDLNTDAAERRARAGDTGQHRVRFGGYGYWE